MTLKCDPYVWERSPMHIAVQVNARRSRLVVVTNGYFGIGRPFMWAPGAPLPNVHSWVRYVKQVSAAVLDQVDYASITIRPPSTLADIRTTIFVQLDSKRQLDAAVAAVVTSIDSIVGQSPLHAHEVRGRRRRPAPVVCNLRDPRVPRWAHFAWRSQSRWWTGLDRVVPMAVPV